MNQRVRSKTVNNALGLIAVRNVVQHGIELADFLRYTGLNLDELIGEGGRIPASKYVRMLGFSDVMLPADLSSMLEIRSNSEVFPELFALLGNCVDLSSAIAAYLEFKDLIVEHDRFRYVETEDGFELEHIDESGVPQSVSSLGSFLLLGSVVRVYIPAGRFKLEFDLTRAAYPSIQTIQKRGVPKVNFGRPRNRLICTTSQLHRPLASYNELAHAFTKQLLAAQLASLRARQNFSSRVEALLKDCMFSEDSAGDVERALQRVCKTFGMSRWTVLRHLRREGHSFKRMLAEIRFEKACRYLAEKNLSVREISEGLGFASQSAFSRFFKAYAGETPAQYRHAHAVHGAEMLPSSVASVG